MDGGVRGLYSTMCLYKLCDDDMMIMIMMMMMTILIMMKISYFVQSTHTSGSTSPSKAGE
jgi:hypothetical protein